jgi:hypothetical protein
LGEVGVGKQRKPSFDPNRQARKGRAFQSGVCGRVLSAHAVAVDKVKVGSSARVSFARFRPSTEGRFVCETEMFRGSTSPCSDSLVPRE